VGREPRREVDAGGVAPLEHAQLGRQEEIVEGAAADDRKAAIRLLRRPPPAPTARSRAGRPRLYGPVVAQAVEILWQATGHIGPHRLHPFPELLDRLTRDGELRLAPDIDKLVRHASPATLGRLLAPARGPMATRPWKEALTGSASTGEVSLRGSGGALSVLVARARCRIARPDPHSLPYALIIVSSILNFFTAFTACGSFAGMTMASPILK
jgi:hypothetical protein